MKSIGISPRRKYTLYNEKSTPKGQEMENNEIVAETVETSVNNYANTVKDAALRGAVGALVGIAVHLIAMSAAKKVQEKMEARRVKAALNETASTEK